MTVKDRRFKRCQHCYERVRVAMTRPDLPDHVVDRKGNPECVPGLLHKVMPRVGGEGEPVG